MAVVYQNTSSMVRKTVLRVHEIEPDLYVFKREMTFETVESTGDMKLPPEEITPSIIQRFVSKAELNNILKGKDFKSKNLTILLEGGRELLRTVGYGRAYDTKHEAEMKKNSVSEIFDAFDLGIATADDVVFVDHSSHMLWDRNGNVLPAAVYFSYLDGRTHNGSYDLKKAAEILLKREDVRVFPTQNWRDEADYDGTATTVKEAVLSIPYYNVSKSHSSHLSFVWKPSVEDYRKMWEECLRIGGQYPSTNKHAAIFNLDLLGLRAGGAAKYKTFYGSSEDS